MCRIWTFGWVRGCSNLSFLYHRARATSRWHPGRCECPAAAPAQNADAQAANAVGAHNQRETFDGGRCFDGAETAVVSECICGRCALVFCCIAIERMHLNGLIEIRTIYLPIFMADSLIKTTDVIVF